MARKDETGRWGEREAEKHLKKKGYRILGRRVRIAGRDEIDLVARDRDVLIFVEVKTRASERYGRPIAAVDRHKRQVTSRAAMRYIRKLKDPDVLFRFDVVEVVGTPDSPETVVRHVEEAYPLDRRYMI
ncbi:MAG: YraN family protein [Kiritimatiellia bacterium]|jgi:putative endonuclease|nr:YraN family protein [Kiritimatiellia bacterium]MDP6631565.1 YraN family protein [Kiritimatiellia bacterium]MDP6810671.1 YraN family protein [Kiritimatiellia bacterium]MDP7023757.1 YraN family protein [Kiritimatiellia bacterium]